MGQVANLRATVTSKFWGNLSCCTRVWEDFGDIAKHSVAFRYQVIQTLFLHSQSQIPCLQHCVSSFNLLLPELKLMEIKAGDSASHKFL